MTHALALPFAVVVFAQQAPDPVAAGPATAPASPPIALPSTQAARGPDRPATPEIARAEAKKLIDAEVGGLPRRDEPLRKRQILDVATANGMLVVRSTLQRTEGMTLLNVPDWPGATTVMVSGDDPQTQLVHLINRRLDLPGTTVAYTHVTTGLTGLIIARDAEGLTGTSSVQYVQGVEQPGQVDPPARLLVRVDQNDGSPGAELDLREDTFEQLRTKHPAEVEKYLQPILVDLGLGLGLSGVDEAAAWQVLSRGLPDDPAVAKQVDTLLPRLAGGGFKARQEAREQLLALGRPGALVLARRDRSQFNPEQADAVTALLAENLPLPKEKADAAWNDPGFMIESIAVAPPSLRPAALKRLSELAGRPIQLDLSSDPKALEPELLRLREEFVKPK
jgi:hypothetical protein